MTKHYTLTDRLLSRPFLDTQPAWSRALYWVVVVPTSIAWMYLVAVNEVSAYPILSAILIAVSVVLGTIQLIYFRRARRAERNDAHG